MAHTYTDILFILAIYNDGLALDELLFHLEPNGEQDPGGRARILESLGILEERGLLATGSRGEEVYARLTALGQKVANGVAGFLADDLVDAWQARRVEPPALPQKAGSY